MTKSVRQFVTILQIFDSMSGSKLCIHASSILRQETKDGRRGKRGRGREREASGVCLRAYACASVMRYKPSGRESLQEMASCLP